MIRTIVCEKEGCTGNSFYIKNLDNTLDLSCTKCSEIYTTQISNQSFIMVSNCCNCNNDIFKVFKGTDTGEIFAKCIECGNPPDKIYIDVDGNQVSYDTKILNDVKEIIYRVDQRLCNLERKLEGLEGGQELLEQSLAYVTRFLSD